MLEHAKPIVIPFLTALVRRKELENEHGMNAIYLYCQNISM